MPRGPKLVTEIGGDTRGYDSAMDHMSKRAAQTGEDVRAKVFGALNSASGFSGIEGVFANIGSAIGLSAAAAFVTHLASSYKERIKEIRIGGLRTGLDSDTFQKVSNLEEATGATGATARSMDHVAQMQQKVKEGGEEGAAAMEKFGRLGATAADVQNKSFQDLTLQIIRYLQNVEITGDKLAALKDVFGKGGTELLPAIKMGLDSATANKGLIDDDDIEKANKFKKAMAESNSFWADMATSSGKVASNILDGLKVMASPSFFKMIFGGINPAGAGNADKIKMAQMEANAAPKLAEQDARQEAKRKAEAEFEQATEEYNARVDEEQKKAEEEANKLESQIGEREQKDKFNKMSPEEKRKYLEGQISDARDRQNAAYDEYAAGGDPRKRLEFAKAYSERLGFEEQLAALKEGKDGGRGGGFNPESDSLARIGGFTGEGGNPNRGVETKLDKINNALNRGIVIREIE